jgi:cysteinyl-tRNA synthetase
MRRQKVPFEPLVPGQVSLYVCGPTPYAPAHIGHAFSAISFDTIRRSLTFLGYQVTYVRNVTDVEDKVMRAAAKESVPWNAISERYAAEYNHDMARFGVLPPDIEPLVSTHIPQIIALIERLVANGCAYPLHGDVYFSVAKFPEYGKLHFGLDKAHRDKALSELHAGARVEVDESKHAPADFALWKAAKPGEPFWASPWGNGRPGWHIECSAMTVTHLGETFDLHGGGADLMFPHHENEIAQSQGAYGTETFARYWMHNGFLNFDGEKMSKSLGNVFGCGQIAESVGAEALRFFCVSHHYRSTIEFTVETDAVFSVSERVPALRLGAAATIPAAAPLEGRISVLAQAADSFEIAVLVKSIELTPGSAVTLTVDGAGPLSATFRRAGVRFTTLEAADRDLAYFYTTLAKLDAFVAQGGDGGDGPVKGEAERLIPETREALADDFNTPVVKAALHAAAALGNSLVADGKGVDKGVRRRTIARLARDLRTVGNALGILAADPQVYLRERRERLVKQRRIDAAHVASLIEGRSAARSAKEWKRADELRDELSALRIEIYDSPQGTDWSVRDAD